MTLPQSIDSNFAKQWRSGDGAAGELSVAASTDTTDGSPLDH